jgi:hypothetical protein
VKAGVIGRLAVEPVGLAPAIELAAKAVEIEKGILERIRIGCAGDG